MTRLQSRVTVAAAAALLVFGFASGCGDDGSVTQQPTAAPAAGEAASTTAAAGATGTTAATAAPGTTAAAAPVETRAEILQLHGALLDGQQFDFASTAGNDVLLWFWAPW